MPHLLICKTNIKTDSAHLHVGSLLDAHSFITDWHIDKEDIDNILRIESSVNIGTEIITTINKAGFICEELPD